MRALPLASAGLTAVLLGAVLPGPAGSAIPDGPDAKPVSGTGCSVFPADNYWNADISDLPRHRRSKQWLARMSTGRDLHPDFGPSYGKGPDYGIPVTVVGERHRRVKVRFRYAAESDRVRYPLGRDTRIEGGRGSDGDRHAIVVNRSSCRLYETFDTRFSNGRWRAGSGAVWDLRNNRLRPDGWTSADAAGLPILPGLLRWNEVRDRQVDHAIRFTTDITVPPPRVAGPARRRLPQQPEVPADGRPVPAQGRLLDRWLRRSGPGSDPGDEDATGWCSPTTAHRGSSRASGADTGRTG